MKKNVLKLISPYLVSIAVLLIVQPIGIKATSIPPSIAITEIAAAESSDTEWIEVCNGGSQAVDLNGWKFVEDGTNHGLSVYRGTFLASAGECVVIAQKADAVAQKFATYTGTLLDSSWGSLKEEGEEIGLKDAAGVSVESFVYPPLLQTAGSQIRSLERISTAVSGGDKNNWILSPTSNSMGQSFQSRSNAEPSPPPASASPPPVPPVTPPTLPPPSPPALTNPPPSAPVSQTPANTTLKPNTPPKAIIQLQSGSLTGQESLTVNFDGRSSHDPDGDTLSFFWDLGDGTSASGVNPGPHNYNQPGTYVVILSVVDNRGGLSSAYQVVQVLQKKDQQKNQTPYVEQKNYSQQGGVFEVHGWLRLTPPIEQKTPLAPAEQNEKKGDRTTTRQLSALTASAGGLVLGPDEVSSRSTEKSRQKSRAYQNGDLSTNVQLTELFPYPNEGDEWIEIFNAGDQSVNLGNWMITDRGKRASPFVIPDSVDIAPGQYLLFYKEHTRLSLNNNGDSVVLADFTGNTIDSISYRNARKGYSYARLPQLGKKLPARWIWQKNPTAGMQNPNVTTIRGEVSREKVRKPIVPGEAREKSGMQVTLADGSIKQVFIDPTEVAPEVFTALTPGGSKVEIEAQVKDNGSYELAGIHSITPPPAAPNEKRSALPWLVGAMILFTLLVNASSLYRGIVDCMESVQGSYARRREEKDHFQKDKTPLL